MKSARIAPPLRIALGAVYWRVFLVTFSIQQFTAFQKTRHAFRHGDTAQKFAAFLDFTPYAFVLACLVAGLVAVGLDLLTRLAARPLAARWYHPARGGVEHTPMPFWLDCDERLAADFPARMRHARGWRPGTLVVTNKSLSFYSVEWDVEPWRVEFGSLASLCLAPCKAAWGSLLLGVPPSVVVQTASGLRAQFALADPYALCSAVGCVATAERRNWVSDARQVRGTIA